MNQYPDNQTSGGAKNNKDITFQDWLTEINQVIAQEECAQGLHSAEFCSLRLP